MKLSKIVKKIIKEQSSNGSIPIHTYAPSTFGGCPEDLGWNNIVIFPSGQPAGIDFGVTEEQYPLIQEFYESAGSPNPGEIIKVDFLNYDADGVQLESDIRCVLYLGVERTTNLINSNAVQYDQVSLSGTYVDGPYNSCEECLAEENDPPTPEEPEFEVNCGL